MVTKTDLTERLGFFSVHNSFGCKHVWKNIDEKHNQSVCTLCNKCCDIGRKCKYNGIMGDHLRECLCKTLSSGCVDCGICVCCTSELWVNIFTKHFC